MWVLDTVVRLRQLSFGPDIPSRILHRVGPMSRAVTVGQVYGSKLESVDGQYSPFHWQRHVAHVGGPQF